LWGALRAMRAKQASEAGLEDADDEDTRAEQEGEYCVCLVVRGRRDAQRSTRGSIERYVVRPLSVGGAVDQRHVLRLPAVCPVDAGTGMNARKLGAICALLAATPNLIGCESSRDSPDRQFQKQVKRAQECRELQDKLVGNQPLTAERAEEITKTMDRTGCTAQLPAH
jgi:hypothetical protein